MSQILYYSSYCENSKKLLQYLSKNNIKDDIHFISIDKRVKKNDGSTFIVLENNQEIILPPTVTRVPALLLLNRSYHVLFGDEIYNHLRPIENVINKMSIKTQRECEPSAYALHNNLMGGVLSDNYSFLDQTNDSLSAKGDGGLRQMYNYATNTQSDSISTPPETYSPDTIGNISIEKLQEQRNKM